MPFNTVTVELTTTAAAHAIGDVVCNPTEFRLPHRSCKLINATFIADGGTAATDQKFEFLFFESNSGGDLGTLNATADITASNFKLNKYQGSCFVGLPDATGVDVDVIDNVARWFNVTSQTEAQDHTGGAGLSLVLSNGPTCFVAGVVTVGTPTLGATDNCRLVLGFEY
jgi:hypothetical protein